MYNEWSMWRPRPCYSTKISRHQIIQQLLWLTFVTSTYLTYKVETQDGKFNTINSFLGPIGWHDRKQNMFPNLKVPVQICEMILPNTITMFSNFKCIFDARFQKWSEHTPTIMHLRRQPLQFCQLNKTNVLS